MKYYEKFLERKQWRERTLINKKAKVIHVRNRHMSLLPTSVIFSTLPLFHFNFHFSIIFIDIAKYTYVYIYSDCVLMQRTR